jgi:uncharacterized membrane protein
MRRSNHVLNLTFFAICTAIIFLMAFVPQLGYITLGIFSITLLHLPVLIFSYLKGYRWGWLYGLMFGLSSYLVAITRSVGALDLLFAQYPIVAILPRFLFGLLAGLSFSLLKTLVPDRAKRRIALIPLCFLLTLIHTILVFAFLYLFCREPIEELFKEAFWPGFYTYVFLTGSLPEAATAAIVVPLVVWPLEPLYTRLYRNPKEERKESVRLRKLLENKL